MSKGAIAAIIAIVMLMCCTTITLIGGILYWQSSQGVIKEVPTEVNTFLKQSDLDELATNGFVTNKGLKPPKIEGKYRIHDWTVKYDKMGVMKVGDKISTCDYTFKNQTDDGRIDTEFNCGTEKGTAMGGYISGSENCFTVYLDQKGKSTESQCESQMPVVMSGCLVDKGISKFQYGNLMKWVTDSDKCREEYMPVGNIRVITPNVDLVDKL